LIGSGRGAPDHLYRGVHAWAASQSDSPGSVGRGPSPRKTPRRASLCASISRRRAPRADALTSSIRRKVCTSTVIVIRAGLLASGCCGSHTAVEVHPPAETPATAGVEVDDAAWPNPLDQPGEGDDRAFRRFSSSPSSPRPCLATGSAIRSAPSNHPTSAASGAAGGGRLCATPGTS
jgi:hypothetical protein